MANEILREFSHKTGTPLWKIADMVGLSCNYFSSYMRRGFPEKVQFCLINAIEQKNNGQEPDLTLWLEWRERQRVLAQAKRNDHMKVSSRNIYEWRRQNEIFDEVEKRRIKGGWDTWQG